MNDEMDSGGGSKRPFGPHGEGCTCDWDEDEEEEGQPEDPSSYSSEDTISAEERAYMKHVEIGWDAAAAEMVESFLDGLDAAAQSGRALSRIQVIQMLSSQMVGFAKGREIAIQIEQSLQTYAAMARRMRKEAEAEAAANAEPEPMGDITSIFSVPPKQNGTGSPEE